MNNQAATQDPHAKEKMVPIRRRFASFSFFEQGSLPFNVILRAIPNPRSVVIPVRCVVRTELPEEDVVAAFWSPLARQRSTNRK